MLGYLTRNCKLGGHTLHLKRFICLTLLTCVGENFQLSLGCSYKTLKL